MTTSRRRLLQGLGVLGFASITGKLAWFEAFNASQFAEEGRMARLSGSVLRALRGEIQDRNGVVLASSRIVYDVAVNQVKITQYKHEYVDDKGTRHLLGHGPMEAAAQLAPLLGVDARQLGAQMIGDSTYVILAKEVDEVTWRKINTLAITGVEHDQRVLREYPAGNVAGNIIGFAHDDQDPETMERYVVGATGLESTQNQVLTGTNGSLEYEKSLQPEGMAILSVPETIVPAVPGTTIRTTIDADLQRVAQDAVDKAMSTWGAEWISVLVTDPATGKILTMVDSDSLDPTNPADSKSTGSRSVEAVYEPGSVGKVVTFAAALEEGAIKPEDTWEVPDYWVAPNGQVFEDAHSHPSERITSTQILINSSNVGTVKVGDTLEDKVRYEYMRKFGWGEQVGIELPGESSGILSEPGTWDGRTRYTTMFGQGVACSPLQVVQTLATIANKGKRVPLRVIDSWIEADGQVRPQETPEEVRVISEQTAATLTEALIGVTQKGGTAEQAAIDGYLVAGKTGTTQILVDDVEVGTVASFVGFLPARAPVAAVSVLVHKPAKGVYGGVVAGPVFREVATAAMHVLDVSPDPSVVASTNAGTSQ